MFSDEIKARIVAVAGITASKIVIGDKSNIPMTGEYLHLRGTGGSSPSFTHQDAGASRVSFENPTLQLVAGAEDYDAARALAYQAYNACIAFGIVLSGVRYLSLLPIQPPFEFKLDDNERQQFAFNIRAVKKPS